MAKYNSRANRQNYAVGTCLPSGFSFCVWAPLFPKIFLPFICLCYNTCKTIHQTACTGYSGKWSAIIAPRVVFTELKRVWGAAFFVIYMQVPDWDMNHTKTKETKKFKKRPEMKGSWFPSVVYGHFNERKVNQILCFFSLWGRIVG